MSLVSGTRLGSYDVVAPLGAGGMGEVYRARDTRLGRDVALKILPAAWAADPDRVARFQREAQVLAALNHQNIAQIYGFEDGPSGASALVMELVEGTTLAERMATGPLPIDDALSIAAQMADALEAAHEKGIIHRDLKPANVMITSAGIVKVLDFGLAAIAQNASAGATDATQSPTLTIAATQAGLILGTAAYMSPEQAAAKAVDKRSDIWSFGVIVWEMLAGRRLFDGETISHTLADVLRAPIDFAPLPRDTPTLVRDLLQRCLDRGARSRLRDIGEARVAIQKYMANPAVAGPPPAGGPRAVSSRIAWIIAVAATAALVVLTVVHFREQSPAPEKMRFQILPPEQTTFINSIALSPDGRSYAFEGLGPDGRSMLWVRSLESDGARALTGTEGVTTGYFWSPDSRFIAFAVNGFPGRLRKIEVTGGPPQPLCEYTGGFRGGDWNAAGVILFAAATTGVWQVTDNGGTPTPVTKLDLVRRETQHSGPVFMPDGRTFLYSRGTGSASLSQHAGIYVGSLDTKPEQQSSTRLLPSESNPVYVRGPSTGGSVLFLREGVLLAQPLDDQAKPSGNAIPIVEDVGSFGSLGWFSASARGHLAFRTGRASAARNQLVWFDRKGTRLGPLGPSMELGAGGVQLSPDGKRVTVTRTASRGDFTEAHIWIADVSRGIFSRLTTGEASDGSPGLSATGRVAFSSSMDGAVGDLYWTAATGIGAPEPLLLKSPTVKHPNDISPDGRFLIYDDHTAQRQDLYVLPIDAPPGGQRKPIPFVVTGADETFGQFSPDGKWIAYSSDEGGRREVYVQGFAPDKIPATAVGKWTISSAGGDKPRWSGDGKELYYIALDRKMMAVPVKLAPTFEPGNPIPLFETNVTAFSPYDVSPDGRFLLNTVSEGTAPAGSPVTLVLNWQQGLKR
jgi:eukaryotic-like serine/threonine-protein kinase